MKKVLFIDRDGTLILEPEDEQIDSVEKLKFYPQVFTWLGRIYRELDYELVMITNQDGLGTDVFPEETFYPVHDLVMRTFEGEGISFRDVYIDRTFAKDNAPTRKPGTGMLGKYLEGDYDLSRSFVIGDRLTDIELAVNLGGKGILINGDAGLGNEEVAMGEDRISVATALRCNSWKDIFDFLRLNSRAVNVQRKTRETNIDISLVLDGSGTSDIDTGIAFFDHMLDQIARHGEMDLVLKVQGDLEVDEHHTIEDTGIVLGEAFAAALKNKTGIERYGFTLPMDDCLAQVAIDFGGRSQLVWDAEFSREMVGKMPTEMFSHFFKSFADGARANLNIKAEGDNEHHKIESIFKAFAKALRKAVQQDPDKMTLPSTKGVL